MSTPMRNNNRQGKQPLSVKSNTVPWNACLLLAGEQNREETVAAEPDEYAGGSFCRGAEGERWFNVSRVSTSEIDVVSELVGFLLCQVRFEGLGTSRLLESHGQVHRHVKTTTERRRRSHKYSTK